MSVSKYAYEPEKCDYDFCPGDCDFCDKGTEINSNMLNNLLKKFPIPEGGQYIIMVKDHGKRQQKELIEKFRQLETILTGKAEKGESHYDEDNNRKATGRSNNAFKPTE